ncbi:DinB family protein [Pedobacter sp. SL55]|uniref:DinB family protein n=1 Tax=Pedobacter sp. SL55 TaxID=2995161 RepID=UPI0022718015|nr:DinB family protein [Pedobacter sp. SL55]WAC41425.1 DinB family protein [Pedobacter sp. SL55]
MDIIKLLQNELNQEAVTTRKFLALVPFDKPDYAPHEKSMKLIALATHIADLASWPKLGVETDELDFATAPYNPAQVHDNEQLIALFDKGIAESLTSLAEVEEAFLEKPWVLRTGNQIHIATTKYGLIRVSLNQITHHRAQLGVYLRLLNIPIPGSYGPSADELNF